MSLRPGAAPEHPADGTDLGLGNAQGLPIVGDNACAERLWSVNAAACSPT